MSGVSEYSTPLSFKGGLNTAAPSEEIRDNELSVCENFWYPDEVLTKRPGLFKLNASAFSPAPTNGLVVLGFDPATAGFVIRGLTSTDLWRISSGGSVTAITNAANDNIRWMIYINGTIYVGTATNGVKTMAGSVGATLTNSPNSNFAAYHKGRLFAGVIGGGGRVAFSNPNAPGTWTTTDTIDVGVEEGTGVTGIISLGDLLLIFKTSSVWAMYVQGGSPADWTVRRIANIGIAPSIGNAASYYYNGDVYFISRTGVFKTNGQSFIDISKNIWSPVGNNFAVPALTNLGQWRITRFTDHLMIVGHYDTYIDAGIAAGYAYTYNLNTGAWSSWTFLGGTTPFNDMFALPSGATPGEFTLLATKGVNIYITTDAAIDNYDILLAGSNYNTFADGYQYITAGVGSAYTSTFRSKKFTVDIDTYLRLKWAGLEYKAYGSPQFKWVKDDVSGSYYTPGYNISLTKGYKIPGAGRCRSFALQGEHSLTSPYEFYRANVHLNRKVPLLSSGTP